MEEVTPLAEEIVGLIPALAVQLRLSALFEAAGTGLTPSQILCAVLVDQAKDRRVTAGHLAQRLSMSAPSTTALVDRLVKAGLLTRTRGDDRRVVWISLTDRGTRAIDRLRQGLSERVSVLVEAMDPPSRHSLLDALRQVAAFATQVTTHPAPA